VKEEGKTALKNASSQVLLTQTSLDVQFLKFDRVNQRSTLNIVSNEDCDQLRLQEYSEEAFLSVYLGKLK